MRCVGLPLYVMWARMRVVWAVWALHLHAAAATPPLSRAWLPLMRAVPAGTAVPATPTSADCHLSNFTQRLDHFGNNSDERTFSQRFFWNDTFFTPGIGPILYYTGNEADVTLYVNATGLMWQHARELGALLVWGEHRYYGETLPFGASPSTAELRWLSVEQSLADHAALVRHLKRTVPGAATSKVVAIGGSYGGMQSSWARMRYPEVFDGAIAGSAPILAFDDVAKASAKKAGPQSYWRIVTDDASPAFGSSTQCADNVRETWLAMDRIFLGGDAGRTRLQHHLSMCDPLTSLAELYRLKNFLIMAWDTMAMGNFPFPSSYLASGKAVLPAYPFRKACSFLAENFTSDDALVAAMGVATSVFNNATQDLTCYDLPADQDYDGIWDYLWCTDTLCQETYFGRNGVDDMFPSFQYDESAIDVHCEMKYNVTPKYGNIAKQFRGLDGVKNSSNIVFSNGRFDPWRSGGVTTINDTDRSLWSIVIPNGAHHVDLMFSTEADPPDLKVARDFEIARIKEWVGWKPRENLEMERLTDLPPPGPHDPVYPHITETVHVINSCHLDIGFADSAVGIINRYFDDHLPRAIRVAEELRAKSAVGLDKLGFMYQSWVLSFYLDCPPNMGLHCPSPDNVTRVERAILDGDITWHAFPHNAQLEIMGPALLKAGIDLTHGLDERFNLTKKTTLSQRDVPGLPRSVIPLLNKSGVRAVSIGANGGSTPPNIPPCFLWKDNTSGTSLLGLFNWPGYGSLPLTQQKTCVVEGLKHALVYNWNGDNAGPFEASEYEAAWDQLRRDFPNAKNIVASTLDNFTQHLDSVRDKLPIIQAEIGDTWIYGVPSDPQKVSRMSAMEKAWAEWSASAPDAEKENPRQRAVLLNATRFALKLAEHTWGRDVKSNLHDNWSWKNSDFHRAKAEGSPNATQYEILEESWWEQRHWGITLAMETLKAGGHPMAKALDIAFAELRPSVPDVSSFAPLEAGTVIDCGKGMTVALDGSGAISHLTSPSGLQWADENHPLAAVKYKTYSLKDVNAFMEGYCQSKASWVAHDYGKPGLPLGLKSKVWAPKIDKAFVKHETGSNQCTIVSHASFAQEAQEEYGAVSAVWIKYEVSELSVGVTIGLFNKTTTRLPESMFVQWHPLIVADTDALLDRGASWSAKSLGAWVDSADIVDGGSKRLFGANALRVGLEGSSKFEVASMDALVASFGELNAYPTPTNSSADTNMYGASHVLWDNLWGTNYIMWWPFVVPPPEPFAGSAEYFPVSGNADFAARFSITLSS